MAKKIQPAQRCLKYNIAPTSVSTYVYVDLAKDLSMVNRRLYEQGKQYFVESIEFAWAQDPSVCNELYGSVYTAGDTWMVHNSWVKAHSMWKEMRQLVLEDNPSIKPKWSDFKVYLNADMQQNPAKLLTPVDQNSNPYVTGEWNYSEFVMPQHDVDPATGEPLAAIEVTSHILGDDTASPLATGESVGLIKAYGQSRATVQPVDPNVPASMSNSFFNLLTDSGSQEPELADVIEDENDQPPYSDSFYPGGSVNAPFPVMQEFAVATQGSPNAVMHGFTAECGLLNFILTGYLDGEGATPSNVVMKVNLMPGDYKGVAALPMGQ